MKSSLRSWQEIPLASSVDTVVASSMDFIGAVAHIFLCTDCSTSVHRHIGPPPLRPCTATPDPHTVGTKSHEVDFLRGGF
jgi:hypothetical protein